MKRSSFFSIFFAGLPLITTPAYSEETLKVVADMPITAEILHHIAPELEVSILLDEHGDAHHFSLKPSQAQMLEEADLIFGMGSNFMPEFVEAAQNVNPDPENIYLYYDDFLQSEAGDLPWSETDPHYWLSLDHANQIAEYFAQSLEQNTDISTTLPLVSGEDIEQFQENRALFSGNRVRMIAGHDAFGYFEDYLDIESYGALHDVNDQPLPPRQYAQITKAAKSGEIQCVLQEEEGHSHELHDFADEFGLEVHSFDILGWHDHSGSNFFENYYSSLLQIYKTCL